MIAVFLRNVDGGFDYPVALLSLFIIFWIPGLVLRIYEGIRTGRILSPWSRGTHVTIGIWVEREKNPGGFWFLVAFYSFDILLFVALVVVISFGLLRNTA
jgi:hypothetical protein